MAKLTSSTAQVDNTVEAATNFLCAKGMTDGLPVVPPTEDRVQAFVKTIGKPPNTLIARIPPIYGDATLEKIAVNAIMAGCRPEYLSVVIATVEAMVAPEVNLNGLQTTTNPAGLMQIINGPIRHELEINCSSGVMGAGWQANATIGRAIRLILLNLGGASFGSVDKSTQGFPGKYTFCISENEEENPWEPLHVERGFRPEDNVVSVLAAQGTANIIEESPLPEDVLISLAQGANEPMCNSFLEGKGNPALLLCPMHASVVAKVFPKKSDFKEYLWEKVRFPYEQLSRRHREDIDRQSGRVIDGLIPMTRTPDEWLIMVTGGPGGLHSTFVPTFGDTSVSSRKI